MAGGGGPRGAGPPDGGPAVDVESLPMLLAPGGPGEAAAGAGPGARGGPQRLGVVTVLALGATSVALAGALAAVALRPPPPPPAAAGAGAGGPGSPAGGLLAGETVHHAHWRLLAGDGRHACSGNGLLEDGSCRCDDCTTGPTCAVELRGDDCVVNANSGTPFLFEDYWLQHPDAGSSILPAYHIGYGASIGCEGGFAGGACDSDAMEQAIRRLHRDVGNFDTAGFEVVVGVGSTQLISAAMWALSMGHPDASPQVWSAPPYYNGHRYCGEFLSSGGPFQWVESAAPPTSSAASPVIEFVAAPNNPDGRLRKPARLGAGGHTVYDFAYAWPHFTASHDRAPLVGEADIALFTLSKLTGHASTRIGWALTKNKDVAGRLRQWIGVNGGLPRENQQRAIRMLADTAARGHDVIDFAAAEMRRRWAALQKAFAGSACVSLEALEAPEKDAFSGEVRAPTPAYAWLKCSGAGGGCPDRLEAHGARGRAGPRFGVSDEYVRVELLMNSATFDRLLPKLEAMARAPC